MVRAFDDIPAQRPEERPVLDFDAIDSGNIEVSSFDDIQAAGSDPIGFMEAVKQDPLTKIPFSPYGVVESLSLLDAAKRLEADEYEKMIPEWEAAQGTSPLKDYPEYGEPGYDPREAHRRFMLEASNKTLEGEQMHTRHPLEQKAIDVENLENYFIEMEERSRRGYSFGGKVGAISSEMVPMAIEFVATGGLKKAGSEAAEQAAKKLLRRQATTKLGKTVIGMGKFSAGATLRAAGLPHRAAESVAKRQLPQGIDIDEDGTITVKGPIEGVSTSIVKGLADHWITVAAEDSGEFMGPVLKRTFGTVARKMPLFGRLIPRMEQSWIAKTGKTVADFNKKIANLTGFHGTLGELGEEWVDMNLKAVTTVEKYNDDPDATWTDQIVGANATFMENLPAMAVAFAIPSGARTAIGLPHSIAMRERAKLQARVEAADRAAVVNDSWVPTIEDMDEALEVAETVEQDVPLQQVGLAKWFTPKWLVNRLVGAETLLADVNAGMEAMAVERTELQGWIGNVIRKLRKEKDLTRLPGILEAEAQQEAGQNLEELFGGEALVERDPTFIPKNAVEETKAHILQQKIGEDSNPVHIMRDLLDTYEDAPGFLSESEANIFNQVRELTRYLLNRVNRARKARGDAEIPDVGAYITHWMDAAAGQEAEARIKTHEGKRGKRAPRNVPNYTEIKRKVHGEMESMFSKDLGLLLQQMVKYDLRDIHITQPYQAALAELNDMDARGLVPEDTYRTIHDYLKYDIREMQTSVDRMFNKSMKKIGDLLGRVKFMKRAVDDPSRQVFGGLRKLGFLSALGFRLKSPLRNLGQRMLLMDLYRGRDFAKAQAVTMRLADMPKVEHPDTGETVDLIDLIREQDWYKITLQKYEDTVADVQNVRSRLGEAAQSVQEKAMHLYSRSHAGNLFLSNVEVAALTGYFDWENSFEQSQQGTEHYKEAKRQAIKLGVPHQSLLTQKEDMLWNVREAVRRTQWEYFAHSMPTLYRGQVARAAFQFKSWMMNYYFNHVRQMSSQMFTNRNSKGRLLTGRGRLRSLKGLGTIIATGSILEQAFGIHVLKFLVARDLDKLFMLDAPVPNFILSLVAFLGAEDERERKVAWGKLKNALKFWTPFSLAGKELWNVLSGEQDFDELLVYKKD
jgi:hypothetical protein